MQRCTEALALSFFFFFTQSIHWQVTAFSNYLLSSYFPFVSMDHSHSHFICIFFYFYFFKLFLNWMSSKLLLAPILLFAKRKLGCFTYFGSLLWNSFFMSICAKETWACALKVSTKKKGCEAYISGIFFKDSLSRSVIQSHSNSEALFHNQMRIPEKKY